jgi:hypothetical protein
MQMIGYSPVSTEHRTQDGASFPAQEAKIEAYCLVQDRTSTKEVRLPSLNERIP